MSRLIISYGDFEGPQYAHILGWLAAYVENDQATSYTGGATLDQAKRLRDALDRQLAGAETVRERRPKGKGRIKL